jgi:hypothetical protein
LTRKFYTTYFGQVTAKKNNKVISINQHTGRPFVRMSDRAKVQEKEMVGVFDADFAMQGLLHEDFDNARIEVIVEVWNKDKRKHDLDNQVSTILDALVKARVIPDDSQDTVVKITAIYKGLDKDDPRAEITVVAVNGKQVKTIFDLPEKTINNNFKKALEDKNVPF